MKGVYYVQTSKIALIHPSFSGLFVTWAYFPQTTLPPWVTRPSSDTLTSMIVPFVMTPRDVYIGEDGFFLTPTIGRQNVAFSSGWVTCAFLNRKAMGRTKRSYLGGFRVNPSPTKQTLVTILFQPFLLLFPVFITLNTSASDWARTLGRGTSHLPAFSFRFCLTMEESSFAWEVDSRSSK